MYNQNFSFRVHFGYALYHFDYLHRIHGFLIPLCILGNLEIRIHIKWDTVFFFESLLLWLMILICVEMGEKIVSQFIVLTISSWPNAQRN